jgi:peptidoglycan hydrolase-like protein with peptidoglycan-binding domain
MTGFMRRWIFSPEQKADHSPINVTIYYFMKTRIILAGLAIAPIVLFAGIASAATISQQLDPGMSNADVTILQTYLAQDPTLYPQGLITGFYGTLTTAAVSNFQARNGIATVGRVGPITLMALNDQMNATAVDEGAGKSNNVNTAQPVISNLAVSTTANSASVTWTSSTAANAKVWYSTTPAFVYKNTPSAVGTGLSTAQNVTINNLQGNTTYYYVVESLDPQGNFSWSQNGNWFKTQ